MDSDIKEDIDKKDKGVDFNNILYPLAAFVIIMAGMIYAKPVIVPVMLSAFIAIIASPFMLWLEERGMPRVLAFLIVIIVVVACLTGVGMILGNSISDFTSNLDTYQEQLTKLTNKAIEFAEKHKLPVSKAQLLRRFDPASLLSFGGYMISGIGAMLSQAMLIFVTVAFILFEMSTFKRKFTTIHFVADDSDTPLELFTDNIKRYLAIKTATSLLTAGLVVGLLLLTGVPYPYLWGMLAFFLNFIPSIGAFLAAIPVVLMALVQFGVWRALGVTVAYTVINVMIGNFIEPRFMGKKLGLSPLVVFLSLIFWGFVLGPAGMFLSVPLTMTLKLACDSREKTKWLGTLLGP